MKRLFHIFSFVLLLTCYSCAPIGEYPPQTLHIVSWGGIPANKADTLFALAKECGFDTHLGLYSKQENALVAMDAAERAGMGIIINFPQLKDSTESAVSLIRNHPALVAYHIKDEPVASEYPWLSELREKILELDPSHPCYINLLPNWSWGVEEYSSNIEDFASRFDLPFYSFDNYPVIEEDGVVKVRPEWYRNLEEFSAMARKHGKPFWAFALAKSHGIVEPEVAFYPEPTLGHLRLQVFSNLLYGAQAIQYFNFLGIVDPATCEKKPAYEFVRQVNSEVRAYSSVFAGCTSSSLGLSIPASTEKAPYIYAGKTSFDDPITAQAIRNCGKWRREVQYEQVMDSKRLYTAINYPLLRYSDVLLMYAEASLEYNGAVSQDAYDCVKALRDRAAVKTNDFSSYDVASFREFVRNERGRELCFEGIRKYDLIRWGIFVEAMNGYVKAATDERWSGSAKSSYAAAIGSSVQPKHVVLPVPAVELGVNNLLVQNPLW